MSEQPMTLVIMAAGMGSRFGGMKQTAGVGPHGEVLLEYAVYDARLAGFEKVIFIIKEEMEQLFRQTAGARVGALLPAEYVFQRNDDLPAGFAVPQGRVKPWGTAHAVYACRGRIPGPFAVINADDFYGRDSFRQLAAFLRQPAQEGPRRFAMVGYRLQNTLTENGSVSRGVCRTGRDGRLLSLTERTCIVKRADGPAYTEDGGATYTPLPEDTLVSMNCWGFPAGTAEAFAPYFETFLRQMQDPLKSEWYLPAVVSALVEDGRAQVQVLPTSARWYGMTYAADRQTVEQALAAMTAAGVYPAPLL
ncbi:MAG: NTP transferase domain-containing protein [Clostridia bacterium]|nr:NTP transferase domain-containing protein [Clostridia bacterium]